MLRHVRFPLVLSLISLVLLAAVAVSCASPAPAPTATAVKAPAAAAAAPTKAPEAPKAAPAATAAPAPAKVSYPTKAITLVLGASAGGGADVFGRNLTEAAKNHFPVPFVLEFKPGGAATVALADIAQAPPDGYRISYLPLASVMAANTSTVAINPKEVKGVIRNMTDPQVIYTLADAPWKTLEEFVAAAKKDPGKMRVSTAGAGNLDHFVIYLLSKNAGFEFKLLPFQGGGEMMMAVLGGNAEAGSGSIGEVVPQIEAKKVRVLAVATEKRLAKLPDVPTLKEKGYDIVFGQWRGIVVNKNTPDAIVQVLHDGFKKAMDEPAWKKWVETSNAESMYAGPKEFQDFINSEDQRIGKLATELGLKK